MRRFASAAFGSVLSGAILALAAPAIAAPATPADASALNEIALRADTVWDAGDAAALAAFYAPDASLQVGRTGPVIRGRDAIQAYFTTSFAQRRGTLRHRTLVTNLEEIAPGLVMADSDVLLESKADDGRWVLLRRFRNHSVLAARDGAWTMIAVRAIPLDAPAPEQGKPAG